MDHLKLTKEKLSIEEVTNLITDSKCGGISVFIGTTRDHFENKKVIKLEYESYEPMALKVMKEICSEVRMKWPTIEHIAIYHRLGTVPVKESSVIIGISAPHRLEAMNSTEWCIDQLKAKVPIWKKEIYEGEVKPQWKENTECPDGKPENVPTEEILITDDVPDEMIQIKASNEEIKNRIQKFMTRKREELNTTNVLDFCGSKNEEYSCARVDAVVLRRKDSKSHLKVRRVVNLQGPETSYNDLSTAIISNGIEERLKNIEQHLLLAPKPVPSDIYQRIKLIEDRILELESMSPEYHQFWKNMPSNSDRSSNKNKRTFSVTDLDEKLTELQKKC